MSSIFSAEVKLASPHLPVLRFHLEIFDPCRWEHCVIPKRR